MERTTGETRFPALLGAVLPPLFFLLLAGCGGGTAGVVALFERNSGGRSTNTPPIVTDLVLGNSRTSPVPISFKIADPESDPASVRIEYATSNGVRRSATLIDTGDGIGLKNLKSSRNGHTTTRHWDFETDLGNAYREHVDIAVTVLETSRATMATGAIGNDPPDVPSITIPAGEVRDRLELSFVAVDSSSDQLVAMIEYDDLNDNDGFRLARAFGSPATEPPPNPSVSGIESDPDGVLHQFSWDCRTDLGAIETEVRLRVRLDDSGLQSAWKESETTSVDNNREPVAILDLTAVDPDVDARRGIVIPFIVADEEGDDVGMVFQWRRVQGVFPELPSNPAMLEEILRDPIRRNEYQIAAERPVSAQGLVLNALGTSVQLDGVAVAPGTLLYQGLVGREIEIVRDSMSPRSIGARDLNRPVDVVLLDSEDSCLVLDDNGSAWAIKEVEIETGQVVDTVAQGPTGSLPVAMDLDESNRDLLVAANSGTEAQLFLVNPGTGQITSVSVQEGAWPRTAAQDVAWIQPGAGVILTSEELVEVRFSVDPPVGRVVASGLSDATAVIADSTKRETALVSESSWWNPDSQAEEGRLLQVDLSTGEWLVKSMDSIAPIFEISVPPVGNFLYLATGNETDPLSSVSMVDRALVTASRMLAESEYGEIGGIAAGNHRLLVVALPDDADLAVGGGTAERRTITSWDPLIQSITVDRAFNEVPHPGQRWRIADRATLVHATPGGVSDTFVWDSDDVPEGGDVVLRAVPYDSELGNATSSVSAIQVRSLLDVDSTPFAIEGAEKVLAGPLTAGPGNDLAVSGGGVIRVVTLAGSIRGREVSGVTVATLGTGNLATEFALADMDGDGRLDVISSAGIYYQPFDGFSDSTEVQFRALELSGIGIVPGDLNNDGLMDLASGSSFHVQREDGTLEEFTGAPSEPVAALIDYNGDGRLDWVGSYPVSRIGIYLQIPAPPGDVEFSSSSTFQSMEARSTFDFGDVTGDGRDDLVIAAVRPGPPEYDVHSFVVYAADGDGILERSFEFIPDRRFGPTSMRLFDVDQDHDLDIVSANPGILFAPGLDDVRVFLQTGPGQFSLEDSFSIAYSTVESPGFLAFSDLDGNGIPDLVVNSNGAEESGNLGVYFGSDGSAVSRTADRDLVVDGEHEDLVFADLDSDGDVDLAELTTTGITVFYQAGPTLFREDIALRLELDAQAIGAADFNGDARMDLVTDRGVHFQWPGGIGLFSQTPDVEFDQGGTTVVVADLDGSGSPDAIVGQNVYLQHAPGVLGVTGSGAARIPDGVLPAVVQVASDVDRDGAVDLVSMDGVRFQDDGGFRVDPDVGLGAPPRKVAVADMDGNGLEDLLTDSIFCSGGVVIQYQTSPRLFDRTGGAGNDDCASFTQVADLDGDSFLDLAMRSQGVSSVSARVTRFLQTTNGYARQSTNGAIRFDAFDVTPIYVRDLNGDGDADYVVVDSNAGGHRLRLHFGGK